MKFYRKWIELKKLYLLTKIIKDILMILKKTKEEHFFKKAERRLKNK